MYLLKEVGQIEPGVAFFFQIHKIQQFHRYQSVFDNLKAVA